MTAVMYPISDATPPDAAHPTEHDAAAAGWPRADEVLVLTTHRPGAVTCVVTATGDVDMFTAPLLDATVWAQLATDPVHLIVNLEHTRFLAACGMHCLLRIRERVAHTGRTQLHLAGLHNRAVARPLQITGLIDRFDTHLTLADALAATG